MCSLQWLVFAGFPNKLFSKNPYSFEKNLYPKRPCSPGVRAVESEGRATAVVDGNTEVIGIKTPYSLSFSKASSLYSFIVSFSNLNPSASISKNIIFSLCGKICVSCGSGLWTGVMPKFLSTKEAVFTILYFS